MPNSILFRFLMAEFNYNDNDAKTLFTEDSAFFAGYLLVQPDIKNNADFQLLLGNDFEMSPQFAYDVILEAYNILQNYRILPLKNCSALSLTYPEK